MNKILTVIFSSLFCGLTFGQVKNIIYVDASNIDMRYDLYDKVLATVDKLAIEGEYVVFISNDSEPIIFDQAVNAKSELEVISMLRPASPSPYDDLSALFSYLKNKNVDQSVKVYVFSSLYVLITMRQIDSNLKKMMVALGFDMSNDAFYSNLSIAIHKNDAKTNELEHHTLTKFYPYNVITF